MTSFDDILREIGSLSWYQVRSYIFICTIALAGCLMTFAQVFIGGQSDHWCKVGHWEDEDCSQWNLTSSECLLLQRNLSTPKFAKDDDGDPKCMKYNLTGIDLETAYENQDILTELDVIKCDEGWHFDRSIHASTITEDWELVCDRSAMPNVLQSVYLAGLLAGCISFGILADRFGRYFTIILCNVLSVVFGGLCVISSRVLVYAFLRFMAGAVTYGASLVCFVLGTEIVLPKARVYFGVALWYLFAIGYFVLSAIGYFVQNWRMQLALFTLPYIITLPFLIILTESPRWLITHKKYDRAEKVIKKIAQINKKENPAGLVSKLRRIDDEKVNTKKANILDILKHRELVGYSLNLIYNWFVQSFVYYGLSLGTSSLGVNVYVAFCISGAVEIPAYTISIFTMKKMGRKLSTGSLMILAGVSCFATIPAPLGPIRVAVAMIGKFAITASFANIYVHTAEIFPTPLRTLGIGSCSVAARAGGIVAPLILVLEETWKPLPLILFASSSVLAGILVFLLPETKGVPMPDTIEDTLSLKKRAYMSVGREDPNSILENHDSKEVNL